MIDTHCHPYDEAFDTDRAEAVMRAVNAGVDMMILPAIDSQSHEVQELLEKQFPQHFRQMMGLHPTSVTAQYQYEMDIVRQKLFAPDANYVAVGEIGLDLYWDKTYIEEQKEVLRQQMHWAKELNLPVCLHVRKAYNELFGLLRDLNFGTYQGVMHCFGGSVQEALKAVDMGFYIGIGGVVTFKNATLAQVAQAVPLDKILLETDAPYLAPVPYRGKRNESTYIPVIAQKIAEIKGITLQQVAETTTKSAQMLFRL